MRPLLMVGIKSRLNLAMISGTVSPVNHIKQAIRGHMSALDRKVAQEKFSFDEVGREGIMHASLSVHSFSHHVLQ